MQSSVGSADFAAGAAFVDAAYVPVDQARVPIMDWGFLHSDATYDVAHVWQGRFFRLDAHLDRFETNVRRLRMNLPYTREEVSHIMMTCVRKSGLRDAYVEMVCTRGLPEPGSRDPRSCDNRFYAFAVPFVWIADEVQREKGLHATLSDIERIPATAIDPTIKNYHWLDFVNGLFQAYDKEAETVILRDRQGQVTEGPGFNVFMVVDGGIVTPGAGVLRGITRATVLELAADLGIPAQERPVTVAQLRAADEVFATSTAGGIMPITRLDGNAVGSGRNGPVTRRICERYWACHAQARFATPVAYER